MIMEPLVLKCNLDPDDFLHVGPEPGRTPKLFFDTNWVGSSPAVGLGVDRVRELHSFLGRWLDENGDVAEEAPEPALHVDEHVTAEDVRRIAADELEKLIIDGVILDRFRALAQEEVQRNNAQHREQMREISRKEIRQYLLDFHQVAREAARVQIQGDTGRDAIVKVMRDTLTRAVELGVDR